MYYVNKTVMKLVTQTNITQATGTVVSEISYLRSWRDVLESGLFTVQQRAAVLRHLI